MDGDDQEKAVPQVKANRLASIKTKMLQLKQTHLFLLFITYQLKLLNKQKNHCHFDTFLFYDLPTPYFPLVLWFCVPLMGHWWCVTFPTTKHRFYLITQCKQNMICYNFFPKFKCKCLYNFCRQSIITHMSIVRLLKITR